MFSFVITAIYSSNLAAYLTVSRIESQVLTLDDLVRQTRIKYAPAKGTSTEAYFKRMAETEEKFYEYDFLNN